MATLIGVVSQVIGHVIAIGADGSRREVHQGDRLFVGEQLDTGADGAVAVHLQNGKELTLGRGSEVTLSQQMLNGDMAPHVAVQESTAPSQAELTDVQKIQQAIAAGADPTQAAEATAAGPAAAGTPGGGGEAGGGHSFVLLTETAGVVDPVVGYPTAGFNGVPEFVTQEVAPLTNTNAALVAVDNDVTLGGLGDGVSVNEANLADGSSPSGSALTQSASFTVSAPDGLSNLTVGGITVINNGNLVGVGQSITTGLGNTLTITGYNPTTGQVSYTYTLTGPDTQPAGGGANTVTENLTVSATDSNGTNSTGSFTVTVVDDVPQAVNDNPTTAATEQNLVLTGNVLTNDIQGADRIAITATSGPITPGTYTGTYGTLVLATDGSYTYTLNAAGQAFNNLHGGGTGTDSFTYTLNDADGDTSTAVLTLNVNNLNDPVTFSSPTVGGLNTSVNEANLELGSNPTSTALAQNGQFTVNAPDGLQTLTIGGVSIVTNGVGISSPVNIETPLGILTINSYTPATGVVSYTYTLTHNDVHADAQGPNTLTDTFQVVATDTDGSTATTQLTTTIVDDVPQAVNDNPTTAATEQNLVLTGNVLTNDTQGADRISIINNTGPISPGTYNGTYGTLVLAADGSYTYTLNANGDAFKNLHGGGSDTDTFTYTLNDADGDTSTAQLTLNINNINDPVTITAPAVGGLDTTVNEANLDLGTTPTPGALTQSGQFTITAPDGLNNLTIGGVNIVTNGVGNTAPVIIETGLGTLTINPVDPTTGVVTYSYTLTHNDVHPDGQGINTLPDTFQVVATDTDGSSAVTQITTTIVDDVPQAVDDNPTTAATEQNLVLTGDVLGNDVQGADRISIINNTGPISPGTFNGTYGTLVLAADGTYTYTLNAAGQAFYDLHGGGKGVDSFTYTLNDADGDTSTATLTLQITNLNDPVTITAPDVGGLNTRVNEANLELGSRPNEAALTKSGQFTITAPDGLQNLTIGGVAIVTNGVANTAPVVIETGLGTLTVDPVNLTTGLVTYSYTLTHNDVHADAQGRNTLTDTFQVVATDTDGSSAVSQLTTTIVDDVPHAVNDRPTTAATEHNLVLTGNVLTNDVQGADRISIINSTGPISPGSYTGTYGTLVLAADGSYTYTLDAAGQAFYDLHGGGKGLDTFTYTLNDADGDTSTATLTLRITNVNDPVIITAPDVGGLTTTVNEANLINGSSPDATALVQHGQFTVSAPDGLQTLTIGGVAIVTGGVGISSPVTIPTALGTLTINSYVPATGVVSYTYTLTHADTHPAGDGTNTITDSFTVVATDTDGSTATSQLVTTIVDDVPQAVADTGDVVEGDHITINVIGNDKVGADGSTVVSVQAAASSNATAVSGSAGVTVEGTYGSLTINDQGVATYQANPNSVNTDGKTDTFTYTIRDADGDLSTTTVTITLSDSGLKATDLGGFVFEAALPTGTHPDSTLETVSGSVLNAGSGGVGALTYTLAGADANGNVTTQYGTLHLGSDGTYTYTLTNAPHIVGLGTLDIFTLVTTDSVGNQTQSQITIAIVDDRPVAVNDAQSVIEGGIAQGNVLANDVGGADGIAGVIGVKAGSSSSTAILHTGVGSVIQGTYGQLVIQANGDAVYHANPDSAAYGQVTDTFSYTIVDKDGDTNTANITITINDAGLVAHTPDGVTVFEAALDTVQNPGDLAPGTSNGSLAFLPGETANGTVAGSVTGGVGALSYSIAGTADANGNVQGQYGVIHMNADGTYTYTLTNAPKVEGIGTTESFAVVTTDSAGNHAVSQLTINIVDDSPIAVHDAITVTEGLFGTGNVLANDIAGADGFGSVVGVKAGSSASTDSLSGGVGSIIQGTYGQLVIQADGSSIYHANPDAAYSGTVTDTFSYTVVDKDGDTSTANITITIKDAGLQACDVNGVVVFEAGLDTVKDGADLGASTVTGSHGDWTLETASGTVAGSVTGGVGTLTYSINGTADSSGNIQGQYGLIHMNADGTYTYTLTSAPKVAGIGTTESFVVLTTDSAGNHAVSQLTINIVDDKPVAVHDAITVGEGQYAQGNVLANDVAGADGIYQVIGVKAGAQIQPVAGNVGSIIVGTYGQLVINADGSSVYHANPNAAAHGDVVDKFTYTLVDNDGDISTATVSITVTDSGLHIVPGTGPGVTVAEAALDLTQDGKDLAAGTVVGSNPDSTAETATGSVAGSISSGSGTVTYSIDGATNGLYTTAHGVIQLNSDGTFTYTLTSAPKTDPSANNGTDTTTDTITYRGTDAQGNSVTNQLVINITDDVPQAGSIDRAAIAPQANTNVLLVIDVSGSMNDASGVNGLTRLELAKQSIITLLNKYDAEGDVKVQVVTFNNATQTESNVWVDVATAKAYIAGLTASGGTNYDYALTAAKAAFAANGKLVDGQNVTYFFSDGNPTLSDTHPSSGNGQSTSQTNTNLGDGIDTTEEAAWTKFLTTNDIKAYAIGLGNGVEAQYLNPIAYDGTTNTNTNAVVVTNLNDLNSVLSSTVQNVSLAGSLLSNGTFGADGGFVKSITVDGVTYTYDPKAKSGAGDMSTAGGTSHGTFDTSTNSITVTTSKGGTVVVDMDNGAYTYTSNGATTTYTDKVTFQLSDNDGDLSNPANLSVTVTPNSPPVAAADHVITNVLSSTIIVPSEALTANDTDANGDPLTVANTGFATGWGKGTDFTATSKQTISFTGHGNNYSNQAISLDRSSFQATAASMTAALLVTGYLANGSSANANDYITVHLKAGESLSITDNSNSHLNLSWSLGNGQSTGLGDGGTLTANTEGDYTIHVAHASGYSGSNVEYTLGMNINYAGAAADAPDLNATYTVSDNHGGSDTAAAVISYQAGHTLTGTSGDDILIGDDSGNTLLGKGGNDFMIGGAGNDVFDGGTGINTVSYHSAKSAVTVDLSNTGVQDTLGAGHDQLINIQNLLGSDYADHLTGNDQANVINGGLGNDVINGGGGNDTIIGGLGDNTLTGGAGADTFQYLAGNSGHDTITDFTLGTDKLDLSQLLQGDGATASTLDDYLHFKVTGSGSGLVSSIDVSTTAGGAATQTIDLKGVDVASHYGVTPTAGGVVSAHDTATIVSGMLGDHSLKVDVA
ncbi:retention module-containing protein [Pseudomonas sp. TE3610]